VRDQALAARVRRTGPEQRARNPRVARPRRRGLGTAVRGTGRPTGPGGRWPV